MKDLTRGSVTRHLLHVSGFLAISMVVQSLYLLIGLYWVSRLGQQAVAAVAVAGNITIIAFALTQMLGTATTTLISQSAGRKDQAHAEVVFNQSFILSMIMALVVGFLGFVLRSAYCESLSADAATATLAKSYLLWFIPALLLQFPFVILASTLRATGIIKVAVGFQVLSIGLNIVLAPVLIFGIGPWPALGVTGAAVATLVSILIVDVLVTVYFGTKYRYIRFRYPLFAPQAKIWSAMLRVGVPAGAELVLQFIYMVLVYAFLRRFGVAAQAAFGVGMRVLQVLFVPVVALSFVVAPLVGQNFGGRRADRVRHAVYSALTIASILMLLLTLGAYYFRTPVIGIFSQEPQVIAFGQDYLGIVSFGLVASGIVFTTSSVFQGVGNTFPPLVSWLIRLALFAVPTMLLSCTNRLEIRYLWYLTLASQFIHACINLVLLRRELCKKLKFDAGQDLPSTSIVTS
ncbi:MAG: hypothetical protein QOI49_2658 [Verrucomicrobiota bacterium]|jgi:putative MATE family efflux protein